MWEVKTKQKIYVFFTLDEALYQARCEEEFVTITNGEMEFVGMFGVDEIKDGICPDGVEYTWVKRRSASIPLEQKAALAFPETLV